MKNILFLRDEATTKDAQHRWTQPSLLPFENLEKKNNFEIFLSRQYSELVLRNNFTGTVGANLVQRRMQTVTILEWESLDRYSKNWQNCLYFIQT